MRDCHITHWWHRKNHQWATQSSHTQNNTCTIKREDLIESTGVVLAKYPLKVKLELFTTLECQSWNELCVPVFWGSLGFYSSVEPISYACATSLFLIEKIFINVRIFQNPPCIRVPFVVGFYGLGLIVRHKLFPFRICWRPRNDQFSATYLFGPSILGPSTLGSSTRDLSTIGFFKQFVLLDESVHLMSIHTWFVHVW